MPDGLTAVIDSTVLVSTFLTEGWVSAELLHFAREGVFLVFLSEDILIETQLTLAYSRIRERYNYTDAEVADFLNRLRTAATLVADLPHGTVVTRDPNDDMVLPPQYAPRWPILSLEIMTFCHCSSTKTLRSLRRRPS